ncbi:MAG: SusC/RagA family TonB-linked outer membrane protein [Ginsengibacter sp.]
MRSSIIKVSGQMAVLLFFILITFVANAQNRTITGTVTSKDGVPLANASVTVVGQNSGVRTDANGAFTINVLPNAKQLEVSYVGSETQTVNISATSNVTVTLANSGQALSEVVVIGYGTVKKTDATGSVTAITAKDFNKGDFSTPEQLIAGKVPGVQITSNSGVPGSGSTIRIRGGASINASNDPLIVIDGVPITNEGVKGLPNALASINPNDIESFNILKDASATAIYGSRGSNGVILITTKKGKKGKAVFNFNTQVSAGKVAKKQDVLSANQFREFVKANGTPTQIALLGNANTDWQDQIFQTAVTTDNNFSISGSLKNLPYRVSLGYLNQDGIVRTDNFQRGTASINLSPSLWDNHLKINLNLKGTIAKSRYSNSGSAIGNAIGFDPTQPVYSGNKNYGGYFQYTDPTTPSGLTSLAPSNPLAALNQYKKIGTPQRSIGNIQLDYKFHFLPELHANVNLGYDIAKGTETTTIQDSAISNYLGFTNPSTPTIYHKGYHSSGSTTDPGKQQQQNTIFEFYLNYGKDLDAIKSRIDAVAGYAYQDFLTTNYFYYSKAGDGVTDSSTKPTYPVTKPQHILISYYGRLNYSYDGKYFLTGTIRTDGSSKFGPAHRWGVFPSGAFAWRIKEESFLKNSKTVSDLKFRVGYGITGQQDGIGNYDYILNYTLSGIATQYNFGTGYYQMYKPLPYNPNLKWEQTATTNLGIDFGFLKNRITGSIDYYFKKTTNLLNTISVASGTNFGNQITANIGNMQNEGVEFNINATPVRNNHFSWDLGFNFTYNENKITKLSTNDNGSIGVPAANSNIGFTTVQQQTVGYPINSFYVFQQVYNEAGKPIGGLYNDINRDGKITAADKYWYKSPAPQEFLGFFSNFYYGKLSAGFSLRANFGNYMLNQNARGSSSVKSILGNASFLTNALTNVLATHFANSVDFSDYFIENASFLRMDNVSFGYNIGKVFHNSANLRANLNLQNAFVITKYTGADPEISNGIDNSFYPRPRTLILGLNLDF